MAGVFQEQDGSTSMRRVLAAVFSAMSLFCYYMGFRYASAGWWVFVPGLAYEVGALLLLFFTTWADISDLAAKIKGA